MCPAIFSWTLLSNHLQFDWPLIQFVWTFFLVILLHHSFLFYFPCCYYVFSFVTCFWMSSSSHPIHVVSQFKCISSKFSLFSTSGPDKLISLSVLTITPTCLFFLFLHILSFHQISIALSGQNSFNGTLVVVC